MIDKRKYPRIVEILALKLCGCESDIVTETKNISANGAYCSVNEPIEPMTKLDIILLVPLNRKKKSMKKIFCKGIVVRKEYAQGNGRHTWNLGIYFNEIKENDRKVLTRYIDSVLNRSPA
jgi:hypothetical protein